MIRFEENLVGALLRSEEDSETQKDILDRFLRVHPWTAAFMENDSRTVHVFGTESGTCCHSSAAKGWSVDKNQGYRELWELFLNRSLVFSGCWAGLGLSRESSSQGFCGIGK